MPLEELQLVFQVVTGGPAALKDANQAIGWLADHWRWFVSSVLEIGFEILASDRQCQLCKPINRDGIFAWLPYCFSCYRSFEDQTNATQSIVITIFPAVDAVIQRYGIDCILAGVVDENGKW